MDWMSVNEVARKLGLSDERVRQLIREKQIKATKVGGWKITELDLTEFIQSRSNRSV